MRTALLSVVALCLSIAGVTRAEGPHVVLLTDSRGYVHDVVKPVDGDSLVKRTVQAVVEQKLGGTFAHVSDAAQLTADVLDPAKTQVLVMYTTGDPPLDLDLLNRYVENGGTLLGIHCATDTFKEDERFSRLIGGTFLEHPWFAVAPVVLKSVDREHPAVEPVGGSRALREEIYVHKNFDPEKVRVLLVLDMERTEMKRPQVVPVTWVRQVGKGRVLYTSLGHNEAVWRSDWFQQHLAQSMKWLTGAVKGSAEPNPQVSEREDKLARQAFDQAGADQRGAQPPGGRVVLFTAAAADGCGGELHGVSPQTTFPRSPTMPVRTHALILATALSAPAALPLLALEQDAAGRPQQSRQAQGRQAAGAADMHEDGFVVLFDGTEASAKANFRGFKKEALPEGWAVEDGALALKQAGAGDIVTKEQFQDFELRFEWKIAEAGNSGVMYRVSEEGPGTDATYLTGPEYQVLDNAKAADNKTPLTRAGALYALVPAPEPSPSKPAGEWNEARIVVRGNTIEHYLNGQKTAEVELGSPDWQERLSKSKFATWPRFAKEPRGHIAFQDHGDPVWYRNIQVKRLGGEAAGGQ